MSIKSYLSKYLMAINPTFEVILSAVMFTAAGLVFTYSVYSFVWFLFVGLFLNLRAIKNQERYLSGIHESVNDAQIKLHRTMVDAAIANNKLNETMTNLDKQKKAMEETERRIFAFSSDARWSKPLEETVREVKKEIGMSDFGHSFGSIKEKVRKLEDRLDKIERALSGRY